MEIIIDDKAGFCFGVVKAIAAAEKQLDSCHRLFCLGDIVHNNAEVKRLNDKGLVVIDHAQLPLLKGQSVLIRAHGEPPSTYAQARAAGITLIDATCPIVLALQQRIRLGYQDMLAQHGQVVIFGKPGHAEVIGLNGQTQNTAVIVSNPNDIDHIDFSRPIRLYSQTTKSKEDYISLIDNIKRHIPADRQHTFLAFDTICNRVTNRANELLLFARRVDVVLFVCGEGSSNGHYLYHYCRNVKPRTFLLSDVSQLDASWFADASSVGITGATSTPRWLMECVAHALAAMVR